jgi:hypothetical protein
MSIIAAALLALSSPTSPPASRPAPALSQRMAPLGDLVGEWRGSGWMMMPDGTRHRFESRETVTSRLSGNALLVEGRHYEPGSPERLIHDAMAMITWDQRTGAYRFRSALANGMGGDFPLEVGPGRFAWRIDTPGGRIDYVAEFTRDTWTERGRRTGPDGRSVDFFEMTLRRQ